MDDRTKGIGDEKMRGAGDDDIVARAAEPTPRRRASASPAAERTRGWSDDRTRSASGIAESVEGDEVAEVKTEQIRAEIEQTRDDLSETIEAIQDRLQPRTIAANAASSVREAASNAVSNVREAASEKFEEVSDSRVVQEVRANPVAASMVAIGIGGLAWLVFGGRDARRRRRYRTERFDHGPSWGYYERDDYYREADTRRRYEPTGAYAGVSSGERTSSGRRDIASSATEYGRDVAWRARRTTRRARNQFQRAMNENPLYVGAAAMAAGAMVGMAIPETERENELMGETRDNLVEGAQEMARDAASRVQQAATDAAKRVQDVAADAVGLPKDTQ